MIITGKATSADLPINRTKSFVHISLCHVMKAFVLKTNKCFKIDKTSFNFV